MICVERIIIKPKYLTLNVGETYFLNDVTICPEKATCKSIRWGTDSTIVQVNATTGQITAKK